MIVKKPSAGVFELKLGRRFWRQLLLRRSVSQKGPIKIPENTSQICPSKDIHVTSLMRKVQTSEIPCRRKARKTSILPKLSPFCKFIKRYILELDKDEKDVNWEFVAKELISMMTFDDRGDEDEWRTLCKFVNNLMNSAEPPVTFTNSLGAVFIKVDNNTVPISRVDKVVEVILDKYDQHREAMKPHPNPFDPVQVIAYQNETHQQQQPISYMIPQLGTGVQQGQEFVVNEQTEQLGREEPHMVQYTVSQTRPSQLQAIPDQSTVWHEQSSAQRNKDIVAQAMQEQKKEIFEESLSKAVPVVKQELGVAPHSMAIPSTTTTTTPSMVQDSMSVLTPSKVTPGVEAMRPYQWSSSRQQVMPRLQILEDEDIGLTCSFCLASYWYKAEIHEHLETMHSTADPSKCEKEEKDKKMRRSREEHQRDNREKKIRDSKFATIRLTSPGARPTQRQRPSFLYRDGALICDLCMLSLSDGNNMTTQWKTHLKREWAEVKSSGRGRGRGRRDSEDSSGVSTSLVLSR